MYRNVINDLANWYQDAQDKVLLIKGGLGVGKTWIVNDFGSAFFEKTIIMDLRKDGFLRKLFLSDMDKLDEYIINDVGTDVAPEKVLIVFDELQVIEDGLDKVFEYRKLHPNYRYCIIESYVGSIKSEKEYNDQIVCYTMMPMTFEEFLTANKARNLCKYIEKQRVEAVDADIIDKIIDYLKIFFVIGGMPAIVYDYIKHGNLSNIEKLQKEQLDEYKAYMKAYSPKIMTKKIIKIWDSIPTQLTKDNRKFMYVYVDPKARAREYEMSADWLVDHGFLRRVYKVSEGLSPLTAHIDLKSFELYHIDHGLLRKMAGVNLVKLMSRDDLFDAMQGALIEQMVLSELTRNQTVNQLYFWISGATARVDFLFEDDGEIIPVDVQSKIRTKAQSIKVFHQKYNNRMAIRISLGELNFSKGVLNIPLYGLWNF